MAPDHGKAPIESPKRSLGDIWTHAVRFGIVDDVMAAGEGIETTLSVRSAPPALPMISALSASHLAAVAFPRRVPSPLAPLYIASDADPAGKRAASALAARVREVGIEAIVLLPTRNDFNDDLIAMGVDGLRAALGPQTGAGRYQPLHAALKLAGRDESRPRPSFGKASDRRSNRLALFFGEPRLRPSSEGELFGEQAGQAMALADYFPAAARPPFHREAK